MLTESHVAYRPATEADAAAAADIIKLALDDLAVKQNQPPASPSGAPMAPALRHVLDTSPERFWVAEADDAVVGFGAGFLRGDVFWLAGLFVYPRWQGKGVGHELLRRAMADESGRDILPVVGSSGANVISNGLYARQQMFPLMPTLSLTGVVPDDLARTALGSLRPSLITAADIGELRSVDEFVTTIDRTADHAWLVDVVSRRGWVFRRAGRVAGYAYLGGDGTVSPDHVGPVAALRASDVAAMLAFALVEHGPGLSATVEVPGANLAAQRLLWGAGFRLAGPVGLLGAPRPFGHLDRYLLAGNVLM